jgi:hypothetical protein
MSDNTNLFDGFLEIAYLTSDVDAAVKVFGEQFGINDFWIFDSRDWDDSLENPLRLALAYTGDTLVELIESLPPVPPLYQDLLPKEGFAIRHHHNGHLIRSTEAWERILKEIERQQIPIAMQYQVPDIMDVVFADTRDQLGHFIEYIRPLSQGSLFFDNIPKN